jgi:hypothetical protein
MATYLIEAPHTKEECLAAVDEVLATGTELLSKFEWGCFAGVHTGWAIVEAESESAARETLPASQRENWGVTAVTKFTPEQIAEYHRSQ